MKPFLVFFLLVVLLNFISIFIRQELNFYPDSFTVTVLFGALIGIFSIYLINPFKRGVH